MSDTTKKIFHKNVIFLFKNKDMRVFVEWKDTRDNKELETRIFTMVAL